MLAARDRLEQVAAMEVRIAARHRRGFGVGEECHALIRVEVVLHPGFLTGGIDPHIGMGAIAVHVPPGARQASLAHQVGDLMRSEEHTSELQSLMRISYSVFCLKKK